MAVTLQTWISCASCALALAALGPMGCQPLASSRPATALAAPLQQCPSALMPAGYPGEPVLQTSCVEEPPLPDGPLTLDQLLEIAVERHPELAAAEARAEAARGKLIQAGLCPNPTLAWEGDDMGNRESSAGKQGPTISQEIVTGGKRRLAQAAAARGLEAADWQALTRRHELLTKVRLAYYDVLIAQREVKENQKIVDIATDGIDFAEKIKKGGIGTEPDVLQAQVELDQSRIRLSQSRQREDAAWRVLAATIGVPDLPSRQLVGDLQRPAPRYEWQSTLQAMLIRSSELQEAQSLIFQAQHDLDRAWAERCPNLHVSVHPFYSFPEENVQLAASAGVALPIFNRNQGNIVSAQADVARANADARHVELRLTERLANAFQRYESARQQKEIYEKQLPKAQESLRLMRELVIVGDPNKRHDYSSVLTAQRTLAQARLAYLQVLGDLWRAASEIAGLLQEESLHPNAE